MIYRLGKKQRRAILTKDGQEVVVFPKGKEDIAELVCKLLNEHSANTPVIKSVCDECKEEFEPINRCVACENNKGLPM